MTFFISFSVIRTPMSETETSQRWSTQFLWIFAAFVLLYNAHLILEWFFCVFFSGVWQKSVQYVGQYGWSQFAQCSLSLKRMRYKSFMKATAAGQYAYSARSVHNAHSISAGCWKCVNCALSSGFGTPPGFHRKMFEGPPWFRREMLATSRIYLSMKAR